MDGCGAEEGVEWNDEGGHNFDGKDGSHDQDDDDDGDDDDDEGGGDENDNKGYVNHYNDAEFVELTRPVKLPYTVQLHELRFGYTLRCSMCCPMASRPAFCKYPSRNGFSGE